MTTELWVMDDHVLGDCCGRCGTGFGEPQTDDDCMWIGHESIAHWHKEPRLSTGSSVIVYVDLITQTELFRGMAYQHHPPSSKKWPGFPAIKRKAQRLQAAQAAIDARLANNQGGDMAKMYGSVAGDRAAGHVCNRDEMTVQAETWKGLIRVVLKPDGNFEVYLADKDHENVVHLMNGNVDARTAVAAGDGKGVAALSLTDPLPRIHVKNRGTKYPAPGGGAPGGGKPSNSSAPATAAATAAPTQTPASSSGGAKAAPSPAATKSKAGSKATKPKPKLPDPTEFKELKEGDKVTLVTKSNKAKAEVGDTGEVEVIKLDGMLGPQLRVRFKKAGVVSLFANEGDKVAKGAVKVATNVKANPLQTSGEKACKDHHNYTCFWCPVNGTHYLTAKAAVNSCGCGNCRVE